MLILPLGMMGFKRTKRIRRLGGAVRSQEELVDAWRKIVMVGAQCIDGGLVGDGLNVASVSSC